MARNVFRPGEVAVANNTVVLEPPWKEPEPEPIIEEIPEYTGPTADQLRDEAELFKKQWAVEKEAMVNAAKTEAADIRAEARSDADKSAQEAAQQKEQVLQAAQAQADSIKAAAQAEAARIKGDAEAEMEKVREAAAEEGRKAGHEDGWKAGQEEVKRLIERSETILARIQDKRRDILDEAEKQIGELCLLIARKVVKSIAESQRETVLLNIKEALAKVKSQGKITVKVNIADLELAVDHKKEFIDMLEGGGDIEIHEDATVDKGGCVVATDYGEIDARIASQLQEMEDKIRGAEPIAHS
jgi:flagellar assembly protein FliH